MKKIITVLMSATLVFGPLAAHAGMISSSSIAQPSVSELFENPQLLSQLQTMGVDTEQLNARLAAMTPAERQQLSERLGEMPAGQDILSMAFALFVLFVITDMLGATDIFPFVNEI